MGRLNQQVAVIAGTMDGVAPGIMQRFAREGATVVMIGPGPDQTRQGLALNPGDCSHITIRAGNNAEHKQDMEKAIRQVAETCGRIDILVNAIEHDAPVNTLENLADDRLALTLAQELYAPLWSMRAVLPFMKKQGGGHILNIVSVYGDSVWRGLGDYNTASEAVKALTRTAAEEWGPYGVLVNAILPAADTPAYQRYRALQPERADQLVEDSALGRMGDPEHDIGGAAMFMVSESGRFITGHMVFADGGQHLTPSPYEALIAVD